ncbi:chondroitin sulfate proteoglycan 4 [Planococcus citri]|uniref:chondroitin sulfate proteoglycan 4 n=1 Tax=Planococcus citri TaxID=170843 RepID=UPI0031FA3CCE
MKLVLYVTVVHLVCSFGIGNAFETASFYGSSYISIPLQDAKSTTEIQLRFRTKQPDALLFLAAGRTDYCLIKLQAGKLKVHINLGAGESELSSPKGLRLDDLIWHQVLLNRREGEVNVTIDKIHSIKEKLPGRFFELNIYDGLFLGGKDDSLELFLGHVDSLRGCLSAVFYNGIDALKRARYRTLPSDAHGITWSCASEFDAAYSSEISFMEEGAFVSLPNPISRTGVRWQFEIKTISENATLFYNSKLVLGGRTDYVGLEISTRKLRLVMDTGSGTTEVFNEANISDGEWHLITLQINPSLLEITVDGKFIGSSHITSRTSNKYLDLSDNVYVGGIELNKRANALAVGMKSADKSFKGCLRNMEADGKLLGFPNAKVTQGVLPNCMWSFPCTKNPCILGSSCSQYGVDSFHCECDKPQCVNPDYTAKYKISSKTSLPVTLEILSLNTVHVMEGENVLITTDNINVILHYTKYGIQDSGVAFYIMQSPKHGSITIGSNDIGSTNMDTNSAFSLSDLYKDKVHYIHDGSENFNDSIVMELEFTAGPGYILPAYLQGKNSFVLHIDVAQTNDPPFLFIPTSKVLKLAEGTRKIITNDLLNATDSDNNSTELFYSVLNQPGTNTIGYIEKRNYPGVPIYSFTQEDVDLGQIVYVHNASSTGEDKVALQVSDGAVSSSRSFLKVVTYALQIHLVNNTGITLAQRSTAFITHHNLSFQTNANDPFLNINYEIVEFPKYGAVQCLVRANNDKEVWQPVTSFTDQQISRGELRYAHTEDTSSSYDVFKFKVSVKNHVLPTPFEFRATFVQLRLNMVVNKHVESTESQIAFVKESHLKVITEPLYVNNSVIVYTLIRSPKVSDLVIGDRVLQKHDTWTQKDISENRLAFRLYRKTFSEVEDSVTFSVNAPQCQPIEQSALVLKYYPSKEQTNEVQVTLRPVQVSEGGQQPLLTDHLNIMKENLTYFTFQILDGPYHGWLDMHDVDHTTIEKRNLTTFINTDIMQQRVTYTHDDSESMTDAIHFLVYGARGENFQYVLKLHVEVLLKNDNPPYCVINKGLNVVIEGAKILTNKDLLYGDPDIDTKPENIQFTRRAIPNGAFTLADPPYNPLFEFTQNDINNRRVMFRQSGPLSGNISLWVSDGNHYSEFTFEIIASSPFIKVSNNSKLLMRQGSYAALSDANLLSTTNINVQPQMIRYKVIRGPSVGQLEHQGRSNSIEVFTQDDLDNQRVLYRHTGDLKSVKDKFTFQVSVQDVLAEDDFHIKLFPSAYWEPIILMNNKTLYVDEADDITITRNDLLVQQNHVPPQDISYYVREKPKYGYLEIDMNGRYLEVDFAYLFHPNSSDETAITFFDQTTVNAEKLHYIQVIVNQTHDRVVLDATNGIMWYRNIILNFIIIPQQLYISSGELTVEEGGTAKLSSDLFLVHSPYYAEKIIEFEVKKFPQHGWLQYIGSSSITGNISKWTSFQLQNQQIQFMHDGSETTYDSMLLVAYAGEKESVPFKVLIAVKPVNDEVPVVVNNTGATVWRGGICNITNSQLAIIDRDTNNSNVTFVIVSAQAGYLAYFSNLNNTIDKFTQLDINSGKVVFVHSGEEKNGEFDVVINDGKHKTQPVTFIIKIILPELHLQKSAPFQIFPMIRKTITPAHLLAWCSDTDKNIFYVIKSQPKFGQLTMVEGISSVFISNFTQADVNASRIWYQHTSHIIDSTLSNDSFVFDVIASYAKSIENEVFNIQIAVSSGGLDGMLDIETHEVEEGGTLKLFINTTNIINFLSSDNIGLRSPILKAVVTEFPQYGVLCIEDQCPANEFTNEEMNAGEIIYNHDHSDSGYDNVTFTIYLEQDNITLCNVTIPITIYPINDQPFHLYQDAPNLSVVQGEKFILTQDQLWTTDKDTLPEDLTYDIINGPSIGSLYVNGVRGAGKFSQADINGGKVMYEHSGPVQATSFHFRVSDGKFPPMYKVFNIHVHAAKLSISVTKPVFILQTSNTTTILASVFNVLTNHKANEVVYVITTLPRFGYILVNNSRNVTFSQNDLKMKKVVYIQTDLTVAGDAFELEATLADSKVKNLRINISVEPLLKIGQFTPFVGVKNCINNDILNADALSKVTNSKPWFTILKKPKHGKIMKIIKRSKSTTAKALKENRLFKQEEIDSFTHDEIISNLIYYVVKKQNTSSFEDGFAFLLSAASVQPAIGELKFHVGIESTMSRPASPPSKEKSFAQSKQKTSPNPVLNASEVDVEVASPNLTNDDYYFAGLLFSILIASLIFVILMRCRTKKRAEEDMKMNPPLPLPRPPDDLLPSSSYPKGNMSLHSTPQCKVIPLGTDSVTSSEHDFNLRYPYGAADEDWSSYDTNGYTNRNNPMLRKNQYWV